MCVSYNVPRLYNRIKQAREGQALLKRKSSSKHRMPFLDASRDVRSLVEAYQGCLLHWRWSPGLRRAHRRLVGARRPVVLCWWRGCWVFLVRHGSVHHRHAHRHGLLHAECLEVHGKSHGSGHTHGTILGLPHHSCVWRRPHHVLHGYRGWHSVCWGPVRWRHRWHGHRRPCSLLLRRDLGGHRHWCRVGWQRGHREVSLWRHRLSLRWYRMLSR